MARSLRFMFVVWISFWGAAMTNEYDLRSAVTFLLVGLGIGAVLALVLGPPAEETIGLEQERKSA